MVRILLNRWSAWSACGWRAGRRITPLHAMGLAGDADFRVAFHHLDKGIERGGVLAEALAFVKREDRDVARGLVDNLATHDRTVLVVDQFGSLGHLSRRKTFGFRRCRPLSSLLSVFVVRGWLLTGWLHRGGCVSVFMVNSGSLRGLV